MYVLPLSSQSTREVVGKFLHRTQRYKTKLFFMMTACNVNMTAAQAPYLWVLCKRAIISRYILGNLHWDVDQ